jgi:hypothetical protein
VILRELTQDGNFNYLTRRTLTLCENADRCSSFLDRNSDFRTKGYYSVDFSYASGLPYLNHAVNGVILVRDTSNKMLGTDFDYRVNLNHLHSPHLAALIYENGSLKALPDTNNESLKFAQFLKKVKIKRTERTAIPQSYGFDNRLLLDAHLMQVDDKTFAIFQIHPSSIDVLKLTLNNPHPMGSSPSGSNNQQTSSFTSSSFSPSTNSLQTQTQDLRSALSRLYNMCRYISKRSKKTELNQNKKNNQG